MTRAEQLRALAERAERGETGRRFEEEILRALGWTTYDTRFGSYWRDPSGEDGIGLDQQPRLTTSIDAQAALGAQVSGIQHYRHDAHGKPLPAPWCDAWACARDDAGKPYVANAKAPTEAAARLTAILRAMAEKEDGARD